MLTWYKRFVLVALPLALSTVITNAQEDACIALLQHGIYASHVTQTSQQSYQEFRSNFCSWYSSYRESHSGGSASATTPVADIPVGISGSMSFGEADALNEAICTYSFSQGANSQNFVDAARYIDPSGAAAFSSCVQAEAGGLKMQTNINDDETAAVIAIAYQPPLGAGPATVERVDTPGWSCLKPDKGGISLSDIVGKTGKLAYQQYSIVCKRIVFPAPQAIGGQQVITDAAVINIGTTAGSFIQQFRPVLYKDPLAETAKVLASYPKGTILPFAGHLEDIPSGWHLCDGHDGTVNLVDYIPYGASNNAQIDAAIGGKHEGSLTHSHSVPDTDAPYRGFNSHVVQDGGSPLTAMGTDTQHHIGRTSTESNLPPTTRILFIEKIN